MSAFLYLGALTTGNVTSANSSSLTSSGESFTADEYANEVLRLDSGADSGQSRVIISNSSVTFQVSPDWDTTPSSTYTFRVARNARPAAGQVDRTVEEVGDRHRSFDGTYRSSIRSRLSEWDVRTVPLTRGVADDLETTLTSSTQPIEVGGDLLSSGSLTDCNTELTGWNPINTSTGHRISLAFVIRESSS